MNFVHRVNVFLAALWLSCAPAFAQYQVPAGNVPVGRGGGNVGFNSLAPGANGNCIQSNGTAWVSVSCAPGGIVDIAHGGTNINNTGSATNEILSYNGAGFIHSSIITVLNAVCSLSPTTCANFFGLYNIVWAGAVSGADTGSRNSNAIAAATAACGSTPRRVFVPAGNYQFATAQQISTSGCKFFGEGPGASTLTYTGTSIGITVGPNSGANATGISFQDIGLVCSSTCTRTAQVQDVEQNIVFDNVYLSGGSTAETVRVTSLTSSTGGSYSVHFVNGTVIANCGTVCLSINPQGVAFAQAIFIDHVFFNGYAAQALVITSGSGIWVTNSRFERHPGTSNTNVAVHVDTSSKIGFRNNYFEEEANSALIEVGGGIASLDIVGNYFTFNNTAGSATSAAAIKHNGSGNPVMVNIKDNTFAAAGTISKVVDFSAAVASHINVENNYVNIGNATAVFDFGASTASKVQNNRLIAGTVTNGIATSVGQSAVAVSGNTFSGTFTTQSQAAQAVLCAATPGASFTTNWMGQVTHC